MITAWDDVQLFNSICHYLSSLGLIIANRWVDQPLLHTYVEETGLIMCYLVREGGGQSHLGL